MTNFDQDDLPPDLSDLGRRMRDQRPVADDAALDRMMPRARTPDARTLRRAPRRTFAVSLATMLAMLSVTGVAAAALFGVGVPVLGHSLTKSTGQAGTATSHALRVPAAKSTSQSTSRRSPSGSSLGSFGTVLGTGLTSSVGANAGLAAGSSSALGSIFGNAGFFQYGPGRLVCRILRFFRLNRIANLLGCP